jgi:hypothetical protein
MIESPLSETSGKQTRAKTDTMKKDNLSTAECRGGRRAAMARAPLVFVAAVFLLSACGESRDRPSQTVARETAASVKSEPDLEKFVASIQSVEHIKQKLRVPMTETCGTGSCFNNNATEICALVGALDIRLNNLITNRNPNFKPKPELQIHPSDLELMKRIWQQCKPSNYQYWNYGAVLHVIYDPDPREDEEIRKLLGIGK